jgi:two-component system, OmpR family, heavy metal sensor histidine kinase CusS
MRSLPIRVRLTLWYFAMFAAAAVLLCATSLWMLQRSVDQSEYHELQERAEDVQLLLSHADPGLDLQQLSGQLNSIYELKDDGKYLQVRDDQGNWLFRSKRMVAENLDLPAPALLPEAGRIFNFRQGTRYVRVLAYPITVRGVRYSVQTGIALNKSMVLVANFRNSLLMLAPVVILLAALGGHVISRKALRPVAELAREARRINDRNLDIRLPVSLATDEISDLSRTLNQMLERIDKAFASVRAFTGNASHELRTPISLLRTEIEVALYRPRNSEEYRAILLRLHAETVRMTTLVESLLSLARADGGAETTSLTPICVNALFSQVSEVSNTAMKRAMLDFRVEIPDESLCVLGDNQGVSRLLSILLENAGKYTPPGGAVRLCAAMEGERVVFSVEDTGIGIAPEHMERIFDRFYRALLEDKSVPAGSGLGLSLAKWIAERHGTKLSVQSTVGKGSRFSFSLESASEDRSAFDAVNPLSAKSKENSRQRSSLAI